MKKRCWISLLASYKTFPTDFLAQKEKANSIFLAFCRRTCVFSLSLSCRLRDKRHALYVDVHSPRRLPRGRLRACASRARSTHGRPWRHATPDNTFVVVGLSSYVCRDYAWRTVAHSSVLDTDRVLRMPSRRFHFVRLISAVSYHDFVLARTEETFQCDVRQFTRQVFKEQI